MKIAIAKIGANITFSNANKSAANADIRYALRVIGAKENDITIATHRTRNTLIPKPLSFTEITELEDFNDFDCVMVFNGSINFFGGAEDHSLLALYRALHKTDKRIYYVQTDGALPFKRLWPLIHKRDWAQGYAEMEFAVPSYHVTYLTQGRDMNKVIRNLSQKEENIVPCNIVHYPWERTILMNHERWFKEPKPFHERKYDLGFGGYTRNTYKRKLIEKYYNSPKMETLLFGNLRGVTTPNTVHHPKVSYQEVVRKMENCRATVIFGDEYYNNNYHTLRMYEAILAGCVVLVDGTFDSANTFYTHDFPGLNIDRPSEIETILLSMDNEVLLKVRDNAREHILSGWDDGYERDKLNYLLGEHLCE